MTLEIRFADAPLGHEIRGIDVSGHIPDDVFAEIEQAYDRYGVVLFRNQSLTPEQQVAFSRRFGPLDRFVLDAYNMKHLPEVFVVSNIVEDGKPIGLADAGRYWHSDMWSIETPPRGSMLYAVEVPHDAAGQPLGDTLFSSMAWAYDELPEVMKRRLEGRKALYSRSKYVEYREKIATGGDKSEQLKSAEQTGNAQRAGVKMQEIEHLLVRTHPRTGRKCLYYSEGVVSHIVGMPTDESAALLAALREHVTSPRFVYRHRWRVGDVVMWDNCSCIHKAIGDFDLPLRRRMHRTTLANKPVAPGSSLAA